MNSKQIHNKGTAILHKLFTVKVQILILSCIINGKVNAQQPSNFFFREPQPPADELTGCSLDRFKGVYFAEEDTLRKLEIKGDTILARKIIWTNLSTEDLKSNPKWMLRSGFLHGIKQNDSLPCVVKKDSIFFGIPYETAVFKPGDNQHCRVLDKNRVVLNYKDTDNHWICVLMHFDENGFLYMNHMDHDVSADRLHLLGSVQEETGNSLPTKVVTTTREGFKAFVDANGFGARMVFYMPGKQ